MRVAGSTLIDTHGDLSAVCGRLAALGFDAVDVDTAENWTHAKPSEIVGNVEGTAERIEAACDDAGLDPVAFNAVFEAGTVADQVEQAAALAQVGEIVDVDVANVVPAPKGESLEADLDRFRALVDAVDPYEFTLAVEAHYHFHTEDPDVALRYVEEVPDLAITLDPSQFVLSGYWDDGDGYDPLLPHVEHVHLRRSRPGRMQVLDGDGVVDVEDVLAKLRAAGYDGALSIEYFGGDGDVAVEDAAASAGALRETVESLLRD